MKQAAGACVALSSMASGDKAADGSHRNGDPFVGIQIASHSFYGEGIDYCLDLLRETGRINALMISSLSYYGAA